MKAIQGITKTNNDISVISSDIAPAVEERGAATQDLSSQTLALKGMVESFLNDVRSA